MIIHHESWVEPNSDPPKRVDLYVRTYSQGMFVEINASTNPEVKVCITLNGYSIERLHAVWREVSK